MAHGNSKGLFEIEYLLFQRDTLGRSLGAAGFLRMQGDECDALACLFLMRSLSRELDVCAEIIDEDNPIAKLRLVRLVSGLLADGSELEGLLPARPILKRVGGQRIVFYPPRYRQQSVSTHVPESKGWSYSLQGVRATASTFLDAEAEAMKLFKGLEKLGLFG